MAVVKKMLMLLVLVSVSLGVGAQVHHIVGGERGWDPYADLGLWSSARTFRVGDKICKPSLPLSHSLLRYFIFRNIWLMRNVKNIKSMRL